MLPSVPALNPSPRNSSHLPTSYHPLVKSFSFYNEQAPSFPTEFLENAVRTVLMPLSCLSRAIQPTVVTHLLLTLSKHVSNHQKRFNCSDFLSGTSWMAMIANSTLMSCRQLNMIKLSPHIPWTSSSFPHPHLS